MSVGEGARAGAGARGRGLRPLSWFRPSSGRVPWAPLELGAPHGSRRGAGADRLSAEAVPGTGVPRPGLPYPRPGTDRPGRGEVRRGRWPVRCPAARAPSGRRLSTRRRYGAGRRCGCRCAATALGRRGRPSPTARRGRPWPGGSLRTGGQAGGPALVPLARGSRAGVTRITAKSEHSAGTPGTHRDRPPLKRTWVRREQCPRASPLPPTGTIVRLKPCGAFAGRRPPSVPTTEPPRP